MIERLPHRAGVMEDAPGIHDIEAPEPGHERRVEHRAPLDAPARVVRPIARLHLARAGDRVRVVVE